MRALLVCLFLSVPVLASKRIVNEGTDGKVNRRTEMLLDGTRMRSNTDGFATLVRPSADGYEFLVLDVKKREYYPTERKFFVELVAALEAVEAQTEKMLASVPAEMREQLAKTLKMAQPVMTYTPAGSDRVAGIPCLVFEQFNGREKVGDVCVARPGDLGISAQEFEIVERAGDYLFKMLEGLGDNAIGNSLMDAESAIMMNPELRGVPMRTRSFFKGSGVYTDTFVSIEDVKFTDADFSFGDAVRADPPSIKMPGTPRP